jgi:Nucleotidyltransferase of unknown function (DUF6036)
MIAKRQGLWGLMQDQQGVDPLELTDLIEQEVAQAEYEHPDFRTRLLMRDSCVALQEYWGGERFNAWLQNSPAKTRLKELIEEEDLGREGFQFLRYRLMEPTRPDDIRQFLRELGTCPRKRTQFFIGGSISLLLPGYLVRRTQDLDVVDEVPEEIRTSYKFLDDISKRYQLKVAHFQSHYLPNGWKNRVHSQGLFGNLEVYLVDVYDVFVGKLFSKRTKDLDDLRALAPQLDKTVIVDRLHHNTANLRADAQLMPSAEKNWNILYGEALPQ